MKKVILCCEPLHCLYLENKDDGNVVLGIEKTRIFQTFPVDVIENSIERIKAGKTLQEHEEGRWLCIAKLDDGYEIGFGEQFLKATESEVNDFVSLLAQGKADELFLLAA